MLLVVHSFFLFLRWHAVWLMLFGLFCFPVCLSVVTLWQRICPLNSGVLMLSALVLDCSGTLYGSINAEGCKSCIRTTCWLKLEKNIILIHKKEKNPSLLTYLAIICVWSCFSFYRFSINILCPSCFCPSGICWAACLFFPSFIQMTMLIISSIFCFCQQIPEKDQSCQSISLSLITFWTYGMVIKKQAPLGNSAAHCCISNSL